MLMKVDHLTEENSYNERFKTLLSHKVLPYMLIFHSCGKQFA